jgi:hypothetical protein
MNSHADRLALAQRLAKLDGLDYAELSADDRIRYGQRVVAMGTWTRDPDAFDPSAQIRYVRIDGTVYVASNLLGPGWPMTVRTVGAFDGWSCTVDWERWDQVAEFIARRPQSL